MAESVRDSYHHGDLQRALVEQAVDAVRETGAAGFSLRAAARAVGVDAAAAYRHFRNKEALLREVAVRSFSMLAERMEAEQVGADSPIERFRATGRAYVRFAVDEPRLFQMAFGPLGAGNHGMEVRGVGAGDRDPYQILLDALEELRAAGLLDQPPEQAALPAWAAVHGLAHLIVDGNLPVEQVGPAIELVIANAQRGLGVID